MERIEADLEAREYNEIPICQKLTITVDEAIKYSGIGRNKLYDLLKNPNCSFKLQNGRKILIKRKLFEKYIESLTVL